LIDSYTASDFGIGTGISGCSELTDELLRLLEGDLGEEDLGEEDLGEEDLGEVCLEFELSESESEFDETLREVSLIVDACDATEFFETEEFEREAGPNRASSFTVESLLTDPLLSVIPDRVSICFCFNVAFGFIFIFKYINVLYIYYYKYGI
jgi:hypothetical protein